MPQPLPKLRRVLVIDDDPAQFRLVQEMFSLFRGERFDLDWCPDFERGLQAVLTGRYCVCLLDYMLGDRNGIDLLREATNAQCRTPIIVLTGCGTDDIDLAAMNAGAIDYIVKNDINPRMLERVLRYTLKMFDTMEALRRLAIRDDLTGLFNRREMERILQEEWMRATRFNREFSVIMMDLDNFKTINDTHGHQIGDLVLRHVASLLAGQVRSVDRVARYGGEEFAIIQIESDREGGIYSAQRLRNLLAEMPCVLPERGLILNVTFSAGVAAFPADAHNVEELIGAADRALYAAKARGRNCVVGAQELPPDSTKATAVAT